MTDKVECLRNALKHVIAASDQMALARAECERLDISICDDVTVAKLSIRAQLGYNMSGYVIVNINKGYVFGQRMRHPDAAVYIIDRREHALAILKYESVSGGDDEILFTEKDIHRVDELPDDIACMVLPGVRVDENEEGVWW